MAWPPLTQQALDRSNREPSQSFVYFILDATNGMVKIGKAGAPVKRLSSLQTATSAELELAGLLAGGVTLEREIHEHFAESRVRGEWFRVTNELIDLVKAAHAAGTRKNDPLPTSRPKTYNDFSKPELTKMIDEFGAVMGMNREHARKYMKQLYEAGLLS